MWLGLHHVTHLAEKYNLPIPKGDGDVYFLTASEVREWCWFETDDHDMYHVQRLMYTHATDYIGECTNTADHLERTGKVRTGHWERKDYLRKEE